MTDKKPVLLQYDCSQCGHKNFTGPPNAYETSIAVACRSCDVIHVIEYRIRLAYPGEVDDSKEWVPSTRDPRRQP
jgi:DNA-directed RNA polymerase subunit RPC12/RpoP